MSFLNEIQRRLLKGELIVSTAINGLLLPVLLWLAPIPAPSELGGADGVAMGLVKGTVIPVFLMTTLITFALHKRTAKMGLAPLAASTPLLRAIAWTPKLPPLRAVIFVVVALATLMPVALGVAALLKTYPLNDLTFFVFNVVYGVVIGLVVTPFVVLAALMDAPAKPRPAPAAA